MILDRIMDPSDPEVLVDQVSDLSSTKETVLFLGLCSSGLILLLNWQLWMILFSAEAIFASSTSKSGIRIPLQEHEDFRSSTESTISTSLIQCIASVGNCEQVHTSVLNPYLPTSKCCWYGEFVEIKIWDLQSLVVCLHNSLKILPHWGRLNFWLDKVLKKTLLDLQKRFPIYHVCPKCLAAHLCGSHSFWTA